MKSLLTATIILTLCISALAGDVSLAWDASVSPAIAGYKVYVGTASRTYGAPITIGDQTTYTVTGLTAGHYYFAVTAFDGVGNESDYSNEVDTVIQTAPPVVRITGQTAQVNWYGIVLLATTDQKATGILRYQKIEPGAGWTTILASQSPRTEHRAVIYLTKGAQPPAYYRYEWTFTDAEGNKAIGGSTFQSR